MNETLQQFKSAGISASFNYADDSGKEWSIGDKHKADALKLFDDNPELQDEMREIARGFLWTLSISRPVK